MQTFGVSLLTGNVSRHRYDSVSFTSSQSATPRTLFTCIFFGGTFRRHPVALMIGAICDVRERSSGASLVQGRTMAMKCANLFSGHGHWRLNLRTQDYNGSSWHSSWIMIPRKISVLKANRRALETPVRFELGGRNHSALHLLWNFVYYDEKVARARCK